MQLLRLEEAAESIGYYLPIRLQSGDASTDKWMKEDIFEQVANALRDKKKWVITPKRDTYEHFVKYIASTLFNIANGNWDALERIKPEKISPRQLWRSRILGLLKTLFIALVPWALLWILQLPPFKLDGTILSYLSIIAYVWAAFTVIAAIDPTFSLKISAVKDITSIIIPTGKNQ